MKLKKLLPFQNPTIEEKLEELMRREQENISLHPAEPEIPDNPSRGWDREEDHSARCSF